MSVCVGGLQSRRMLIQSVGGRGRRGREGPTEWARLPHREHLLPIPASRSPKRRATSAHARHAGGRLWLFGLAFRRGASPQRRCDGHTLREEPWPVA